MTTNYGEAGGPIAADVAAGSATGLEPQFAGALAYLPYVIALPLVAVFAFLFDGVFIGATRTAEMRNGSSGITAGGSTTSSGARTSRSARVLGRSETTMNE